MRTGIPFTFLTCFDMSSHAHSKFGTPIIIESDIGRKIVQKRSANETSSNTLHHERNLIILLRNDQISHNTMKFITKDIIKNFPVKIRKDKEFRI